MGTGRASLPRWTLPRSRGGQGENKTAEVAVTGLLGPEPARPGTLCLPPPAPRCPAELPARKVRVPPTRLRMIRDGFKSQRASTHHSGGAGGLAGPASQYRGSRWGWLLAWGCLLHVSAEQRWVDHSRNAWNWKDSTGNRLPFKKPTCFKICSWSLDLLQFVPWMLLFFPSSLFLRFLRWFGTLTGAECRWQGGVLGLLPQNGSMLLDVSGSCIERWLLI